MRCSLSKVLAASAALAAPVGASGAVALASVPAVSVPSISVPSVSVPSVSLPSLTVPSVSVPSLTVPSVTVPPVTVGPVTTPSVATPSVSTPSVTTPSVTTPSVSTPTLPPAPVKTTPVRIPPVLTPTAGGSASGSHSTSQSGTGSVPRSAEPGGAPAQAAGAATTGGSSSGAATRSRGASGTTRRAGHSGSSAAGPAGGGARRTQTGRSPRPGTGSGGGAAGTTIAAATRAGQSGSAGSAPQQVGRAAASTGSSGPFVRLVKELPTAVLFALLAFAVIAAAMALNAYLQSRRARSLSGQRAALLSDVGVLQAALLPAVPGSLGELAVSVAYRPAQGLAAGGDFFDVFTLSAERTGIIIGDVSGHGRESLIHAALVRYTLRTLMGEGHPLPEVLARADRYLSGELGDGFATVIVCTYEHATGELTWAKAGHEPPILAGQPDPDEQAATPLGFGFGDAWPEFSRSLVGGERVCLFTDGLIEARRQGEHLGRAHLKALVEQGLSAQDLVERIQADADECSDDLAAVVLTRAVRVPVVAASPAPEAATVS